MASVLKIRRPLAVLEPGPHLVSISSVEGAVGTGRDVQDGVVLRAIVELLDTWKEERQKCWYTYSVLHSSNLPVDHVRMPPDRVSRLDPRHRHHRLVQSAEEGGRREVERRLVGHVALGVKAIFPDPVKLGLHS